MDKETQSKERKVWQKVVDKRPHFSMSLGEYFSYQIFDDPKHLLFSFSRYKFASRLLTTNKFDTVLELGCNEGIGTLFLKQAVRKVVGVDFDEKAIAWAQKNLNQEGLEFLCGDFVGKDYGKFDAIVMLDVIEHIYKENEVSLCKTIINNLKEKGVCIIGTPNISAQKYASELSNIGHVNMFDAERLTQLLSQYFDNVFIFSCNDEVIHTGYSPMAHYLIALGCSPKISEN